MWARAPSPTLCWVVILWAVNVCLRFALPLTPAPLRPPWERGAGLETVRISRCVTLNYSVYVKLARINPFQTRIISFCDEGRLINSMLMKK